MISPRATSCPSPGTVRLSYVRKAGRIGTFCVLFESHNPINVCTIFSENKVELLRSHWPSAMAFCIICIQDICDASIYVAFNMIRMSSSNYVYVGQLTVRLDIVTQPPPAGNIRLADFPRAGRPHLNTL